MSDGDGLGDAQWLRHGSLDVGCCRLCLCRHMSETSGLEISIEALLIVVDTSREHDGLSGCFMCHRTISG